MLENMGFRFYEILGFTAKQIKKLLLVSEITNHIGRLNCTDPNRYSLIGDYD